MNLNTDYLGMVLRSPLAAGASPLSENLGDIRRLEDAGASAIVLHSLFEEQLIHDRLELQATLEEDTDSFSEAQSFFPAGQEFRLGPEAYLEHVRKARAAVSIPIIASLNGSTPGGWTEYAKHLQAAGANAIELNIYFVPADPEMSGARVEQRYLDILQAVKAQVTIPVAVKLSPFFSNMAHMAKRLDAAGADALVLFNRFYQPDIDLDTLTLRSNVLLSTPMAMRLPMRWIAILFGRIGADLAASSGIHRGTDVLKLVMSGAKITMMTSALLRHGVTHLRDVEREILEWMEAHEYESIRQMLGSMSQARCPDPAAFERAHYVQAIGGYRQLGAPPDISSSAL